jgi:outer membrane lipoprotein-sorting protein
MRSFSLAGILVTTVMVTSPSVSQTLPVEVVLAPPNPADVVRAASEPAGRTALTPPPLPTRFQPLRSPGADIVPAAATVATNQSAPVARPAALPAAKPPAAAPARPEPVAATEPGPIPARNAPASSALPAAAANREPLDEPEIVARANAYFTNLRTLVADFTQIGADGRRIGGTIYLQRPGKVRFEYDKPSTLEVIADGSSVAVRDTKLATQDLYSISQTPLKFLLRDRVNLGQDIKITGIATDGGSVRISLEDRSTLGGTSRITLSFDDKVETLTQWRIVDPQGYQTVVVLNKTEHPQRVDQTLFVINYDRAIPTDSSR